MKCLLTAVVTVVLVSAGSLLAEEPAPSFQHVKGYGPFLGTWLYEGPLLEDAPDIAKQGSKLVFRFSWRRILNKAAVEETWSLEFEGGYKLSGKALIGWDAKQNRLVYGGMHSDGGLELGTVELDTAAKTWTLTSRGTTGEGGDETFKGVVTKTSKDTLTWKALEHVGGFSDGPSPEYTFKRVPRPKQQTPAK